MTSVKKQENSIIKVAELRDKINSLLFVMGRDWSQPGEVLQYIKAKNFPYRSDMLSMLIKRGVLTRKVVSSRSICHQAILQSVSTETAQGILLALRVHKPASKVNGAGQLIFTPKSEEKASGETIRFTTPLVRVKPTIVTEENCIAFLKSKGYRILKPVTEFKEV